MACGLSIPGIEVDIRFTADSIPILIHDRSVDRTSNGTGNVDQLTLATLKQLDFGSWFGSQYASERIPTLREFLAVAGSCGFDLIQLDTRGFLPLGVDSAWVSIAREVNRANLMPQIQFGASGFAELKRVRVLIPGARTVVYTGFVTSALVNDVIQSQVNAVSVPFAAYAASSDQIARLDSMGISVGVWGLSHVSDLNGLVPVPEFVISDWPWMLLW